MPTIVEIVTKSLHEVEKQQEEVKLRRDQLIEAADRDPEYLRLVEEAKLAAKAARLHKEAILNEPEYRELTAELQQQNRELKDLKQILSSEILVIVKDTDSMQFEDADGNLRQISIVASAKKTNQRSLL